MHYVCLYGSESLTYVSVSLSYGVYVFSFWCFVSAYMSVILFGAFFWKNLNSRNIMITLFVPMIYCYFSSWTPSVILPLRWNKMHFMNSRKGTHTIEWCVSFSCTSFWGKHASLIHLETEWLWTRKTNFRKSIAFFRFGISHTVLD